MMAWRRRIGLGISLIILMVVMAGSASAQVTNVSACGAISSPGTYLLNKSLSVSSSTCINITSDNVIFDGQGYSIHGSSLSTANSYGVYVYNSGQALGNVTVKNLVVTDWYYGIYYRSAENGTIENNTAYSNTYGIYLSVSSNGNTITTNTLDRNEGSGIYLNGASSNTITNNTAYSNTNTYYDFYLGGISLHNSSSNTITNNNASNNNVDGIFLNQSSNNYLANNNATSNTYSGILVGSGSDGNTITNNNATSNNRNGISLHNSSSNTITNNNATSNNRNGISLNYFSNGNTIANNKALSNANYGILLQDSSNNYVANNTAHSKSSSYAGIYLYSSGGGTTINNTITNNNASNTGTGIYLNDADNSTITNNNATSNNYDGIWVGSGSDGNTITNNNASNNGDTGIELYMNSNSNTIINNTANSNNYGMYLEKSSSNTITNNTVSGNTLWDFYSRSNSLNNVVTDLTINPTISFTGADIAIKSVSSPPSDPSGYKNISHFINATSNSGYSSWLFLNVSYSDSDVSTVDESSLRMWRYSGSWTQVSGTNGVNTASNYVYAYITSFSVFAPMAQVGDTTPPTIIISSPANASTSDTTPLLNASFGETVSYAWYNVNGTTNSTPVGSTSNLTLELPSLGDGQHNITVYANDSAGNLNSSTVYFTIDTTPPTITITSPANTTYASTSVALNVSASEAVSSWFYSLNGAANVSFTPNTTITAGNGANTIVVWANDSAGNWGTATSYFTVDSSPPSLILISPAENQTILNSSVTFMFYAVDNLAAALSYNLSIDGVVNVSTGSASSNANTSVAVSGLGNGNHNWSVVVWDSVSNKNTSVTRNFTVLTKVSITPIKLLSIVNTTNSSGIIDLNSKGVPQAITERTGVTGYEYTVRTNGSTPVVNLSVDVFIEPPSGVSDISNTSGAVPGFYYKINVNDSSWFDNVTVVQLRIYYNISTINLPSGISENTLRPVRYTNGSWVRLDCASLGGCTATLADGTLLYASGVVTSSMNATNPYVWANLSNFSTYGIGGGVSTSTSTASITTGGGGGEAPPRLGVQKIATSPADVANLVDQFLYFTKEFYVVSAELAGVLGSIGHVPTSPAIVEKLDRVLASPVKTLTGEPYLTAKLTGKAVVEVEDPYAIASEKVLEKYSAADRVVFARGDLGVDSIAAVAYARALKVPILLVRPGELPVSTEDALLKLGVKSSIVVGGSDAVSEEVAALLPGASRIWGTDRYETAVELAVALEAVQGIDTIIVTNGLDPDINAVMLSDYYGAPIVYVRGEEVPKVTKEYLEQHKIDGVRRILTLGLPEKAEKMVKELMS